MMNLLTAKYRQFCEWQKRPYQVAPLSDEEHDCATCDTHYTGNYCPRCGQSAAIGRYSFKSMSMLFLDVWGMGNRGMFRSLRDLILRPGYMIRDYLRGMQMAYFPPFKMFFLLLTFSVIIQSGLNIKGEDRTELLDTEIGQDLEKLSVRQDSIAADQVSKTDTAATEKLSEKEKRKKEMTATIKAKSDRFFDNVADFADKYTGVFAILSLLLFSYPLYLMLRKCPAYPGLRFSEFFVAIVYTINMLSIYSLFIDFFCLPAKLELAFYALSVIPIKQLTGYSYWLTALKMLMGFVASVILPLIAFMLIYGAFVLIYIKLYLN